MDISYEHTFSDRLRFEDNTGRILEQEDLDEMDPWEIEERGLHIAEL